MGGTETLPERLARVEGRVEEHSRIMEDIAGRFTMIEGRFDRMEANVNARFERVEARMDHLDGKIDRFRDELGVRIDRLDGKLVNYFTWMIGVTLASWLSLMYQVSKAIR